MRFSSRIPVAAALILPMVNFATAAADMKLLPAACEEALALSALPKRLRAAASVYVLTEQGYELTRRGSGPFTCIVERNHEESLIPQCPDAAGAESVIPGIVMKSRWALEGLSAEERRDRFRQQVDQDRLQPPSRPGVSYMMSEFNLAWNARADGLLRIPPHVMFYAPNLGNEDIGGSVQEGTRENRGVPFIVGEGIHGYIISFVEHASDSADVLAACDGLIPEAVATFGQPNPDDAAGDS